MNRILKTLVILAFALFFSGCGEADATEKVAESTNVQPMLEFSCEEVSDEGFIQSHSEATLHNMSTQGKAYQAMIVKLANYDRKSGSYHPGPAEEGERRIILNFSAPSGQDLVEGTYSVDAAMGEGHRLSIGIEGQGAQCGLSNGSGSGEITAIDASTLEGRVQVTDEKGTSVTAVFSTNYSKSRY